MSGNPDIGSINCDYIGSELGRNTFVRIIVTGGAGFIGSHIVDAYLAAGHEVLVLDSLWEHGGGSRLNVPDKAALVHMDVRDEGVARIFQEFRPDIVSHHAAQHSVAISSRDPRYDADVNVMGMINILEQCVKNSVKKVLFASSGATFGTPEHFPIVETTPQYPTSPYGITKMVTEHYLRFYKDEKGLDFTALRYGNVYGPRQDPNGEAGVISIFIGKFLKREGIRIDWDGEQTRDYVFVKDVAKANILALEKGSGSCYVIGTNKKTSVNDIYSTLVQISGFEAPVTRAPRRPGDARDAQFDPALAKKELGWEPQTQLLDGMQQTYDYFKALYIPA
ncbi:MAG: GDP-mannose 4,6-dehydratase [Candidatus Eremiobacteraeota bacterium]|nr:GDP-mannose 4,6-dehydratase [Candidatus Eremiobacteraeota bacterium]